MKITYLLSRDTFTSVVYLFKKSLDPLTLISFIGLGLIAITLTPFISYPIQSGLDPSWIFFINKYNYFAQNNPYKFGLDVFFTYGPLGFVFYPNNGSLTYLAAMFIQLVFWILCILFLFVITTQTKFQRGGWLIILFSFLLLFPNNTNVFFLTFLLSVVLIIRDVQNNFYYLIAALLVTCIMIYAKFNIGILFSSILGTLYVFLSIKRKWQIKSRYTAAYLFFYCIVLPAIYLFYTPSIKGLYQQFYYSFEIARGYSAAMSLENPPILLAVAVAYILVYIVATVYLFINGEEGYEAGFVFIPGLFFSFKSGFVRPDASHLPDFFNFYIISIAVLFLITHKVRSRGIIGGTLILTSLLMGILFYRWSLYPMILDSISSSINRLQNIPHEVYKIVKNDVGVTQSIILDTRIKQIVRNKEVIVMPHNLLIAYLNNYQLSPMPVLQNYAAFTDKLDKLDANFIEKSRRNQFILFEFDLLDKRNPFTDTPMLWQSILRWYDVKYHTDKFLLLERRSVPKPNKLIKIQTVYASKNDEIHIPHKDNPVIAKIYMNYSLVGQINQFFYQVPPIYMKLSREKGEVFNVRVIASTLHNGVFINYFPTNLEESFDLIESNEFDQTSYIQFTEESTWDINPELKIEFYEILND